VGAGDKPADAQDALLSCLEPKHTAAAHNPTQGAAQSTNHQSTMAETSVRRVGVVAEARAGQESLLALVRLGVLDRRHTLRRLQHRMQLCCVWQGKRHRRLRRLWQPIRLPLPLLQQLHGLLPRQLMRWRLMTHLGRQSVGLFAHVHARGRRAGQHRQWITHYVRRSVLP